MQYFIKETAKGKKDLKKSEFLYFNTSQKSCSYATHVTFASLPHSTGSGYCAHKVTQSLDASCQVTCCRCSQPLLHLLPSALPHWNHCTSPFQPSPFPTPFLSAERGDALPGSCPACCQGAAATAWWQAAAWCMPKQCFCKVTKGASLPHGHVVNRRPEKPTVHAELALSVAVGFFNDIFY